MAFFSNQVDPKDIEKYVKLAESGKLNAAVELFISKYILTIADRYAAFVSKQMARAENYFLPLKDWDDISISITSYTTGFYKSYTSLFGQFIKDVFTDKVFKLFGITSPFVRKTVKAETIKQFKELTRGALSQTNRTVKKTIRALQTNMIKNLKAIEKLKSVEGITQKEITKFQKDLEKKLIKKNIDFYNMKDNGQLIKYSNGRLMPLNAYSKMATRTTILNVERKAVEINDKMKKRRMSGYVLRDLRSADTERDICKHVLSKKFYGISLLAHDQAAADIFGVMTIEGARGSGAMGPNCRHSIVSLDETAYGRIDNILYFSENQVV